MKRILFVLPIVIFAFYLIYVLPFGLKQINFEKDFNILKPRITNYSSDFPKISSINTFNDKIYYLILIKDQLKALENQYFDISLQRNFFRKTTWKKQTVFNSDLRGMDSLLTVVKCELPIYLSNIIKLHSDKIASFNSEKSNINTLKISIENYKYSLTSLIAILDELNSNIHDTIIRLNNKDLEIISANNSIIVKKIGEVQVKRKNDFYNTIKNTNSVKEINSEIKNYTTFLGEVKSSLKTISEIGVNTTVLRNASNKAQKDIAQIKDVTNLLKNILTAQCKSNGLLKSALQTMDVANSKLNKMEKFESSEEILKVYDRWLQAEKEVKNSSYPLYYNGKFSTHKIIWNNLTNNAKQNINRILADVTNHKNKVYDEYLKAVQEESTYVGKAKRKAGRIWNKVKKQASSSRIGRELSLCAKMLVLGTKAFYDLQDPNTDPLTWAMSYEDDVNSLIVESEEIMEMDEPSLTGKNTFIELYVDKAYDKSFK